MEISIILLYYSNTLRFLRLKSSLQTPLFVVEKSGKKYTPQTEGHPDPCTVTFVNNPGPDYPDVPTSPTEATTAPAETKDVPDNTSTTEQTPNGDGGTSGKDNDGSSRPKTGDDSTLDFYLLLAIIASAGLFMLSVLYYRSVVKQTQKR